MTPRYVSENLPVSRAAADAPDRVALIAGDRQWTYGELAPLIDARAVYLVAQRSEVDQPVGFVVRTDVSSVLWLLAAIEAGIAVVPVHPRLADAERLRLRQSWPQVRWIEALPDSAPPVAGFRPLSALTADAPLAIVQSSGTTGAPKGVVLSRRAFIESAWASACNLGWQEDDRWLVPMPLAHVGGLSVLTRCLLSRRTVVLLERFTPTGFLTEMARSRVTLVSVVPTMLARIFAECPDARPAPALRAALLGGDGASASLLEHAAALGWPVLTTYGLTESCSQVVTQDFGTRPDPVLGSGRPLSGVELRISRGREIELRGPMLLSGYYPLASTDPPFSADGFFSTGDLGRLDESGNLHVFGRARDVIITGGENVMPAEVEIVLARHAQIADVAVLGKKDPERGQILVAAIVPSDPAKMPATAALAQWLEGRLASFKRPRRFYVVDKLPRTGSGKPDRRAIAELVRLHGRLLP